MVAPVTLPPLPTWITDLPPATPSTNGHRNGHTAPATPEQKTDFRELMARAGVQPRRGGQELVICPWHGDHAASLSVNWEAAVFCCHGCDEKGGLKRLRELGGVSIHHRPPARPHEASEPPRLKLDSERERMRLSSAMKQAGLTTFNRATGRALGEEVLECHRAFSKYECPTRDGRRKVLARSCDFRLCPMCLPTRLRADFNRHKDSLPGRVSLYVWKPENVTNVTLSRRDVGDAFKRWRREQGLTAGFYGVRFNVRFRTFDVLLMLPAESGANASLVAADVDIDQAIEWYVQMFLEEATSWRTPEELLDLLAEVKGCRRFQGFGAYYERGESVGEKHLSTDTPKKLGRVCGGSSKGGGREPVLCECGARMRFVGIALSKEEADRWVQGGTTYLSVNKCSEAAS